MNKRVSRKPTNRVIEDTKEFNNLPSEPTVLLDMAGLKDCLPKNMKHIASMELLDAINGVVQDPEYLDTFRDSMITFQSVLMDGRYTVTEYINAIKFYSFKVGGLTDKEAYALAFPERISRLRSEGKSDKQISSYISAFTKGKLIQSIYTQAVIPNHILYQDLYHKALMTQVQLMTTATHEKVRCEAANSVLTALKQPDTSKIKLDISSSGTLDAVSELKKATQQLVNMQKESITGKATTAKTIAESQIIEAEYVE